MLETSASAENHIYKGHSSDWSYYPSSHTSSKQLQQTQKNASKEKLKPSNEIARKNIFHQKHSRKHNSSNNTNTYPNNTKN